MACFQLTEIGESGVNGAHVQRRVKEENNQEHVNVIHQLHNMEERNVMERHKKVKFVTKTYPAQVSLVLQSLYSSFFLFRYAWNQLQMLNFSCISSNFLCDLACRKIVYT